VQDDSNSLDRDREKVPESPAKRMRPSPNCVPAELLANSCPAPPPPPPPPPQPRRDGLDQLEREREREREREVVESESDELLTAFVSATGRGAQQQPWSLQRNNLLVDAQLAGDDLFAKIEQLRAVTATNTDKNSEINGDNISNDTDNDLCAAVDKVEDEDEEAHSDHHSVGTASDSSSSAAAEAASESESDTDVGAGGKGDEEDDDFDLYGDLAGGGGIGAVVHSDSEGSVENDNAIDENDSKKENDNKDHNNEGRLEALSGDAAGGQGPDRSLAVLPETAIPYLLQVISS
jgi:hypothetical protein